MTTSDLWARLAYIPLLFASELRFGSFATRDASRCIIFSTPSKCSHTTCGCNNHTFTTALPGLDQLYHSTHLYYTGLYTSCTLMAIPDCTGLYYCEIEVFTCQNCCAIWHVYYTKNTHVCSPVCLNGRHIPQTAPDIWTHKKAQPPLLAWGGREENGFFAQAGDQCLPLLPDSCTVVDHTPRWTLPLWSRAELPGLGTCTLSASLSPSSVRRPDKNCDYTVIYHSLIVSVVFAGNFET